MSRFSMYPFSCTIAGPTAFNLQQLDRFNLSVNAQQASIIPGGAVDVACTHMSNADPMVEIGTRDCLTFLTACSPSAILPFTAGVGRAQKRDENGTFLTSTNHETYNIAKGVLVPGSISASQDDQEGAMLSLAAHILYDGTNLPVTRSTGVDFSSAPAPACISRYFLGPIYIDATQIANIERASIDFGVNYAAKGFNGSPYPTEGAIITRTPTISLTSSALAIDAAVSMFLRAMSGDVRVFFQKGVHGSDRVAAASSAHLKISATGGTWGTESVTTQGNEDGSVTCRITPTSALAVAVASAIA